MLPIALNLQHPEPRIHDKSKLDVIAVWQTIQGEGPYTGAPSTFVRLAGCNWDCSNCDTNYTIGRHLMTNEELIQEVESKKSPKVGNSRLVVITGGEPFRQEIGEFTRMLLERDYNVQIETNGTLSLEDFPYVPVIIVCSPKARIVNQKLHPWIEYLKYVGKEGELSNDDGLPLTALGGHFPARPWNGFKGVIYLQPLDEGDELKNQANLRACAESCMKFGYILGVQVHKLVGLE